LGELWDKSTDTNLTHPDPNYHYPKIEGRSEHDRGITEIIKSHLNLINPMNWFGKHEKHEEGRIDDHASKQEIDPFKVKDDKKIPEQLKDKEQNFPYEYGL